VSPLLRRAGLAGLLLCAAPAFAQTTAAPATPTPETRHKTVKHSAAAHTTVTHTAGKHATSGQATHVPVLAPRHPGPPRHAAPARTSTTHKAAKKELAVAKTAPPPPPPAKKPAAPPVPADVGSNTGLHLPRYASLKSDDVNMRVGPAERYPVIWTYKRRELPVRIDREFDIWRLVEDMDGIKGWVHQATLTGRRTFVVTGAEDRTLRADASETADAVALIKRGVVGRIRSCEAGKSWCQVQVQDYRGWLPRDAFWGVDPDEVVTP
jgi:SH3-like domain-containing protein